MDEKICEILEKADWDALTPKLIDYADWRIRRCRWRGVSVEQGQHGQLLADGKSADDFVNDAIDKLLAGDRKKYDFTRGLEFNLKGIIRSLVSNHKKKSDRKPLDEHKMVATKDGDLIDTTENVEDHHTTDAERNERIEAQKRLLADFEASIADDKELSLLLTAFQMDISKNALIEKETDLPADRVSELKRKLEAKFIKFQTKHPDADMAATESFL